MRGPSRRSLAGAALTVLLTFAGAGAWLAAAPTALAATTDVRVVDDGGSHDGSLSGKRVLAVRSASLISPVNDLRVSLSAGVLTVADAAGNGPRVNAGTGCDRIGGAAARVTCAAAGIEGLFVSAGPGDDQIIVATPLPSILSGDAGDDRLVGGPAADHLRGGDGTDALFGREGADTLDGSRGTDRLDGNQGGDVLHGDAGNDVLVGDETTEPGGNDVLDGAEGDDKLIGAIGDDRLRGGPGADEISGGSGVDTVDYSDHITPVTVSLDAHVGDGGSEDGPGEFVSQDVENVVGTQFDDLVTGSAAPNRLEGGRGRDLLDGADGDDLLLGGAGPDLLAGGPGIDTASYADHTEPLEVALDDVANDGGTSDGEPFARDDVRSDVENLVGGSNADALVGAKGPNRLEGGPGADFLQGAAGDDALIGRDGPDLLAGGEGRDTLDGGADNDELAAGGDGEVDLVACGKGLDRAFLDLVDEPVGSELLPAPPDCESIQRAARRLAADRAPRMPARRPRPALPRAPDDPRRAHQAREPHLRARARGATHTAHAARVGTAPRRGPARDRCRARPRGTPQADHQGRRAPAITADSRRCVMRRSTPDLPGGLGRSVQQPLGDPLGRLGEAEALAGRSLRSSATRRAGPP
jgi:Ca2+-binding RTX toxin-like protein